MKSFSSTARRAVLLGAVLMAASTTAGAQRRTAAVPATPDDKTIVHVLNRLGFGPAPGDVERVRRIGLEPYIEQQLHPARIADEAIAARLAGFETLALSTRELADEYYLPAVRQRREAQQAAAARAADTDVQAWRRPSARRARQGRRPPCRGSVASSPS